MTKNSYFYLNSTISISICTWRDFNHLKFRYTNPCNFLTKRALVSQSSTAVVLGSLIFRIIWICTVIRQLLPWVIYFVKSCCSVNNNDAWIPSCVWYISTYNSNHSTTISATHFSNKKKAFAMSTVDRLHRPCAFMVSCISLFTTRIFIGSNPDGSHALTNSYRGDT